MGGVLGAKKRSMGSHIRSKFWLWCIRFIYDIGQRILSKRATHIRRGGRI
jgi:hypothetical protein